MLMLICKFPYLFISLCFCICIFSPVNNTSTVDHSFDSPGTFTVNVSVSNHLTQSPVIGELKRAFVVVEKVENLQVRALFGHSKQAGNSSALWRNLDGQWFSDPVVLEAS